MVEVTEVSGATACVFRLSSWTIKACVASRRFRGARHNVNEEMFSPHARRSDAREAKRWKKRRKRNEEQTKLVQGTGDAISRREDQRTTRRVQQLFPASRRDSYHVRNVASKVGRSIAKVTRGRAKAILFVFNIFFGSHMRSLVGFLVITLVAVVTVDRLFTLGVVEQDFGQIQNRPNARQPLEAQIHRGHKKARKKAREL